MSTPTISELFQLPEQVKKADFVLRLAEGVAAPEQTVQQYVVTPSIVRAFDTVLGLTRSALQDGRSLGLYVHGSFGSGKSHFMAMYSLMLQGTEAVWRVPELHGLKEKHRALEGKKLLQLRFHMVGQKNLESAVFSTYAELVREKHPEAALPALFDDQPLFENARTMLQTMGDEKFFAALGGSAEAAQGWGSFGAKNSWDRARFEQVVASSDAEERAQLYTALTRTLFSAFQQQGSGFVDIDQGLSAMSAHARKLGYQGIVLFLDELVLWLSQGASRPDWLHEEAQKVVKLVEAQHLRELPIVSLVARQRDLAEMVGEQFAGSEAAALQQSLKWSHERFDRVNLEDTNLPTIVSKRILQTRPGAEERIDAAFAKLKSSAHKSWNTLLGQDDADAFRKLYPFSPALVEALVALSNTLQRNRTAIRLLTEMLVEHVPDLPLGEVVPVGDLFDLIAGGDGSADGVMKPRLDSARHLYAQKLLPLLQARHGATSPEQCQRLRPGHPQKLGCARCPQKACRNDNRLVKTLLLAALVPEVPSLKGLTIGRLVKLNHGAIKVMIPGSEASQAAKKVQDWAREIGQLHLGSQDDPTVSVQLDGVDLEPILAQHAGADTRGARQRRIRDMLFEAAGLPADGEASTVDYKLTWYGTTRAGQVHFGNARKLAEAGSEQLTCPTEHDWRLVIDYPFDEPGFGPEDDIAALEALKEKHGPTWTLCWLPSFFSEVANKQLGQLVVLDHILRDNASTRQATQDLSPTEQQRAVTDLRNLQTQKEAYIRKVLEQAYGLRNGVEEGLDADRRLANNLFLLADEEPLSPKLAASLDRAIDSYIPALLEKRYPRHPHFDRKLTKKTVAEALELFGRMIDGGEKRLALPKDKIALMMGTLGQLGVVHASETAVLPVEDKALQRLERQRLQHNEATPSVAQLRAWMDEENLMGLTHEAESLLIRAYARWDSRTLVSAGQPFSATEGRPLPDDVELEKPELPTPSDWEKALGLAGAAFGLTFGSRAINADNVKRFETQLAGKLQVVAAPSERLPAQLERRGKALEEKEATDRLRTALSARELCAALAGQPGVEQVRRLAQFEPATSARALGKSLASAQQNLAMLENDLTFGQFDLVAGHPDGPALLDEVRKVLRQDEVVESLSPRIHALAGQALAALTPPPGIGVDVPKPVQVVFHGDCEARGRSAASRELEGFYTQAKARLAEHGSADSFQLRLDVTVRENG